MDNEIIPFYYTKILFFFFFSLDKHFTETEIPNHENLWCNHVQLCRFDKKIGCLVMAERFQVQGTLQPDSNTFL